MAGRGPVQGFLLGRCGLAREFLSRASGSTFWPILDFACSFVDGVRNCMIVDVVAGVAVRVHVCKVCFSLRAVDKRSRKSR